MSDHLEMTFEPTTIEHLGVRLYSTLPPILAELISNSYDADAGYVILTLNDSSGEKEIIIEDDGEGMSFKDVNEKFLRIGRNRRDDDDKPTTQKGRKVIGKKGLGKLSFFGVAQEIEITTRKSGKKNVFKMAWSDIKQAQGVYRPEVLVRNEDCPSDIRGTKIVLRKIQRKSPFDPEGIADGLARMFIMDPNFRIEIRHSSGTIVLENERRYANLDIEFEWEIPGDPEYKDSYDKAKEIKGQLIATKKPIKPSTNIRGIILFSRKKMVNTPEFFSNSVSSHFFSYLTGWLEVDFIDDIKEDVIATHRQSLNWEHPEMKKLRTYLGGLILWHEKDWRKQRELNRQKKISTQTGINVSKWLDTLPSDTRKTVEPLIDIIMKDSELSEEVHTEAVKKIHTIVPEYPKYHWRHLHPEVKDASQTYYQNKDYYKAFQEAVIRYINAVKDKSGSTNSSDSSMMGEVFGTKKKDKSGSANSSDSSMVGEALETKKDVTLLVAQNFKRQNGNDFRTETITSIEEGQKYLSMGVVSGCRNPLSHEEIVELRKSGLFTDKDCLDALSLLSHLFTRFDNSKKNS